MTGANYPSDTKFGVFLRHWSLAFLVALALVAGGGGSPSPVAELLLQLAGAAVLVGAYLAGALGRGPGRLAWGLAGLAVLLPLTHLVPLPPALWQTLPGREHIATSLALTGNADAWWPLSIAPERTLASLLAIALPAGVFLLAAAAPDAHLRRALWAVVATAMLAALLGVLQVASDGQIGHIYTYTHRGWVTGFFANRNAAADHFVIALLVLGWLAMESRAHVKSRQMLAAPPALLLLPAGLLLVVALVMTGSRAGLVLMALITLVSAAVLAGQYGKQSAWRLIGVACVLAIAIGTFGWMQGGLRGVLARFGETGDMRADIWPDALHAAQEFWPFGAGMGSFREAFAPSQSLETVGLAAVNRAHNDYLEFAIEGGLLALAILVVAAIALARNAWTLWQAKTVSKGIVLLAASIIMVLAIHSALDYPLRTMALACVGALFAGILAKPARAS